jgi:hypothetical protein
MVQQIHVVTLLKKAPGHTERYGAESRTKTIKPAKPFATAVSTGLKIGMSRGHGASPATRGAAGHSGAQNGHWGRENQAPRRGGVRGGMRDVSPWKSAR